MRSRAEGVLHRNSPGSRRRRPWLHCCRSSTQESAVLVGDTPSDVRGGLAAGVRVVAVATGRTTPDELRAAGAAEVVNDLADTDRMLRLLTG
ncbi:HAD hydrolase-like protein [Streptomyces antioxidans]|uniref:HAD hydrolase-like protein n=1 Tax=Streptomyces antioxidans TaxID=1507734 RepID=UPI003B837BA5